MDHTNKERWERYINLSAQAQLLYSGAEEGEMLRKIFTNYQLQEEFYKEYALTFGDVILGFEEESRLPQLLVERLGLPEQLATAIAHDLLEFINTHKAQAPKTAQQTLSQPQSSQTPIQPEVESNTPPSWTKRTEEEAEEAMQHLESENIHEIGVPSYARPLVNPPSYKDDPYREKPQ